MIVIQKMILKFILIRPKRSKKLKYLLINGLQVSLRITTTFQIMLIPIVTTITIGVLEQKIIIGDI